MNGSDLNTCNDPATPCRTFTGAISQTTSGGEVVVLDSGTFGGGTISQAVTISGHAGVVALVASPITVSAGASDKVTFRGITFVAASPGSGIGLTFSSGDALFVEDCEVHGWNIGLYAGAAGGVVHIARSTFRENTYRGAQFQAPSGSTIKASIEGSHFDSNQVGLDASTGARVTVMNSTASGNSNVGMFSGPFDANNSQANIEDCVIANNAVGGVAVNSSVSLGVGRIRISHSVVTNNGIGLFVNNSGVIVSRVNNTVEGNGTDISGSTGTFTAK